MLKFIISSFFKGALLLNIIVCIPGKLNFGIELFKIDIQIADLSNPNS